MTPERASNRSRSRCIQPINAVPLAGAGLIADTREDLAQSSRAQRKFRFVFNVQMALGLHVGQDSKGIERGNPGGRMAHQHDGGRVFIDQLPFSLLWVRERGRQAIYQALAVLEGVHHDGLDAVAIEQFRGTVPAAFRPRCTECGRSREIPIR